LRQEFTATVQIIQSNVGFFIDVLPINGQGPTLALGTQTEVYFDEKIPQVIVTTKPIMNWTLTLAHESTAELEYLADTLYNITHVDVGVSKDLPRNTLVVLDEKGKQIGTVESSRFEERIPAGLSSNSPVVFDVNSMEVSELYSKPLVFPPTNSQTVKIGRYLGEGIVAGTKLLGGAMERTAKAVIESDRQRKLKNGPNDAVQISAETRKRIEQVNALSVKAAAVSGVASSVIKKWAGKAGESLASAHASQKKDTGKDNGKWHKTAKNVTQLVDEVSTTLEHSFVDVVDKASVHGSAVVSQMYGTEAGEASVGAFGILKNSTIVYVDMTGVTRKAIVTGVAKGALKYKLKDGRRVSVTQNDNGFEYSEIQILQNTF
jgi:hypothetical protein